MGLKAAVYDAKTLAPEALASLVRELTPVFTETFGMDEAQVTAYCVKPEAERTHIVAYRAGGACVGYFVMHFFETTAGERPCAITRGIVGFKRAWRSSAAFGRHALWFLLRWMVRHPRRPLYGVGLVMHPASYISLTTHLPVSWPRPEVEIPPEMADLLQRMADVLHMQRVDTPDPLVRSLGVASRSTAAEQAYWREVDHPLARYFLAPTTQRGPACSSWPHSASAGSSARVGASCWGRRGGGASAGRRPSIAIPEGGASRPRTAHPSSARRRCWPAFPRRCVSGWPGRRAASRCGRGSGSFAAGTGAMPSMC